MIPGRSRLRKGLSEFPSFGSGYISIFVFDHRCFGGRTGYELGSSMHLGNLSNEKTFWIGLRGLRSSGSQKK